jgi:GNAT superfamily N-acetyltransferase
MSSEVHVRAGRAEDAPRIAEFQCAMALETEGKALRPEVVERAIRRAMGDPSRGEYFVAEVDGRLVGSLMLTREWSDWRDAWWVWIQSVYTAPEARRRGVYRALYAAVRTQSEAAPDVLGIRLYVEEANASARSIYERLGMQASSYCFYEAPLGRGDGADRPTTP